MIHSLLALVSSHYETFMVLSKSNPVVGGMLGLWGLSVITFACKNIPASIYSLIKEQSTTSVVLNSQDSIYYLFLKWISKNKLHSFMRKYNLSGTSHYGTSESIFTMGYGSTFIMFNGIPIFLYREKIEGNATDKAKETITISVIGRSTKSLRKLFQDVNAIDENKNTFRVYKYREGYWNYLTDTQTRNLDSLALPKHTLDKLIKHIDDYSTSKEWFQKHGIIYKTGILLQGPPGTGKTSLVTAMCSKYKKNCYLVDLNQMNDESLTRAIAAVPEGQIILMEDIDAYFSNREEGTKSMVSEIKEIQGCSLIGILNALDGIACGIDRIVFATTNHPENLDPALIREGRFDLKLTIDHMEDVVFKQYFHKFYPSFSFAELANWKLQDNIAPCKVQQVIFENRLDPMTVLHEVANRVGSEVKVQ